MKMLKKLASENENSTPSLPSLKNSKPSTDKIEKEKMILKILKYQESKRFGERIKKGLGIKYTRTQLLKCSNDNLESILYRIRIFLNNSNLDAVFDHMVRYTAKGYEDFVSNFYDIEGFSDILLSNPAWWDLVEKYKIEQEMPDIPPSLQMVYIIASTTYIAHLQNQLKERRSKPIKPQKEEIVILDEDDKKYGASPNKVRPVSKKSKMNQDEALLKRTKKSVGQIL